MKVEEELYDISNNLGKEYYGDYQFSFNFDIDMIEIKDISFDIVIEEASNYYYVLFNDFNSNKIKEHFEKQQFDLIEFEIRYMYIENKMYKVIDYIYFNKNAYKNILKEELSQVFSLNNGLCLKDVKGNIVDIHILGLHRISKEIEEDLFKNIKFHDNRDNRELEILAIESNRIELKHIIEKLIDKKIKILSFEMLYINFTYKFHINGLRFKII